MEDGIRYRLLLYDEATNKFVVTVDAEVGVAQNISVELGQSYKWYAYSYNTSDAISIPSDLNNPMIATPTATTLLYASGTVVAYGDGTPLPITFAHQLTQLRVEVSEGIRAVLSAEAQFSNSDYIKTSSFSLKNGAMRELISANISEIDFERINKGDTVMQVAHYFTADNQLSSFEVDFSLVEVQYTSTIIRQLTSSQLPNNGHLRFEFPPLAASKKGYVLKGMLNLTFLLPEMKIIAVSNSTTYGYKLDPGTASGSFIRSSYNFGPSSNYVKIQGLVVSSETITGGDYVKNLLADPSKYPDILVIANASGYLSAASWDAVGTYLAANGNVFYTQDGADALTTAYLTKYLGGTVTHHLLSESGGVYKFTDTPEAEADVAILKGPFGDVRPYQWGQDVAGTTYVVYEGNNIIRYSTHSQNFVLPGPNHTAFFRHKKDSFFYVSDGGFLANTSPGDYGGAANYNIAPFRTVGGSGANRDFPVISDYGTRSVLGSLTYYPPHSNAVVGTYPIANSMVFGNIIAWMLNRAHYYKPGTTAP